MRLLVWLILMLSLCPALALRAEPVAAPAPAQKTASDGPANQGEPVAAPAGETIAAPPPDGHDKNSPESEAWWQPKKWDPAHSEPWSARPYLIEPFTGPAWGEEVLTDEVILSAGLLSGVRFGREFDPGWGWEIRLAMGTFGAASIVDGAALPDADLLLADLDLVSTWKLDPRWDLIFSFGAGLAHWDFVATTADVTETTLLLPFALGFRYRYDDDLALRLEVQDNVSLGERTGSDTVHVVALNFGLELRFGGPRLSYDSWFR
ncbi:MAG: hypothetical protein HYS13_08880 [Planctomycetia bacterium]|nr:hypothetical protein [Planctomycetia bacterium]